MHFIHTLLTLLTASVLGAAIGYERQFRQRTAGLRTNTLVATSAAIFVHLAMTIDGSGGAVRVISYVVSGVGFLGAPPGAPPPTTLSKPASCISSDPIPAAARAAAGSLFVLRPPCYSLV